MESCRLGTFAVQRIGSVLQEVRAAVFGAVFGVPSPSCAHLLTPIIDRYGRTGQLSATLQSVSANCSACAKVCLCCLGRGQRVFATDNHGCAFHPGIEAERKQLKRRIAPPGAVIGDTSTFVRQVAQLLTCSANITRPLTASAAQDVYALAEECFKVRIASLKKEDDQLSKEHDRLEQDKVITPPCACYMPC